MVFIVFTAVSMLPYALSNWLVWQNLKLGTSLPVGGFTGKHGNALGYGIKIFFFGFIIALIKYEGFIIIASFPIVWFLSGWFATILERKIYMMKVYDDLIDASEGYMKNGSPASAEYALHMMKLPDWWLKLMSPQFRDQYFRIKLLIENDVAN